MYCIWCLTSVPNHHLYTTHLYSPGLVNSPPFIKTIFCTPSNISTYVLNNFALWQQPDIYIKITIISTLSKEGICVKHIRLVWMHSFNKWLKAYRFLWIPAFPPIVWQHISYTYITTYLDVMYCTLEDTARRSPSKFEMKWWYIQYKSTKYMLWMALHYHLFYRDNYD